MDKHKSKYIVFNLKGCVAVQSEQRSSEPSGLPASIIQNESLQ